MATYNSGRLTLVRSDISRTIFGEKECLVFCAVGVGDSNDIYRGRERLVHIPINDLVSQGEEGSQFIRMQKLLCGEVIDWGGSKVQMSRGYNAASAVRVAGFGWNLPDHMKRFIEKCIAYPLRQLPATEDDKEGQKLISQSRDVKGDEVLVLHLECQDSSNVNERELLYFSVKDLIKEHERGYGGQFPLIQELLSGKEYTNYAERKFKMRKNYKPPATL